MKKRISFAFFTLCLFVSLLPVTASAAGNPFPMHYTWEGTEIANCTYVAWQQAYDRLGIELSIRGNAKLWLDDAARKGYSTGTTPQENSIVVFTSSGTGHVAYVTAVSDGNISVVENGNWNGSYESSLSTPNPRSGAIGAKYGANSLIGYIYLTGSATGSPTVTFTPWENAAYTYIREIDASIGQRISVSGGSCTETGIYLYNYKGDELAKGVNNYYDSQPVCFWINRELGYTLDPGTTYKYKFYAVVNGETYWSTEYSFATSGTHTHKWNNEACTTCGEKQPGIQASVTFAPWENAAYTYIRGTDAAIGQRISVSGGTCTETGMVLYDASGRELGKGVNNYYDTQPVCFWINEELGVTLTSGTTYKYKFYAVVGGKTYWSEESSFTTQGTVAVSSVSFEAKFAVMEIGDKLSLSATVLPENAANKTLSWTSSNTDVVTVDQKGLVTAVGDGKATVIATADGKSATCSITVIKNYIADMGVHFEKQTIYYQDQFTDVPANQWYTPNVASAFELGLMKGNGDSTFNPYGDVTVAEAVTMAARIHSIYTTGAESFEQTGSKWYQVYLDYALENGIISRAYYNSDVTHKATRAQFAEIFAAALPSEALGAINSVADNAIPDVSISDSFAASVYKLYRAGILTGSDANGTFNPTTYITRAEAAAIVSRMAESDNRVSITLN